MSTIKVNTIQNTSGVEVYTAKAWVNFNGTGTVAIRASGNVSSITDNSTGDYTVNFTTAMPDANFSLCSNAGTQTGSGTDNGVVAPLNFTTSSARILTRTSQTPFSSADFSTVCVSIFR